MRKRHTPKKTGQNLVTAVTSNAPIGTGHFDLRALEAAYGTSTHVTTPYTLPRRSQDIVSAPPRIPAAPGRTSPPPRLSQTSAPRAHENRWKLIISNHTEHTITSPTIIGRRPDQTSPSQHTITIDDPQHIISRNHVEIAPTTDGRLWAADLDSGNGTYLTHDGHTTRLHPHTRTIITTGDTLRIGPHSIHISAA
ncbi:FHA domain-containing protein [Pseudoclavibacter sp. CFCC 13796]|uniref:FHA domain-containing protein n=1 Tax=unclassified Pseudoclavibacter TaxID=2615177 RepID=UPI00130115C9|nr:MULTISPECIES: FHA domain-containing protein [unclassified Pseudoclavibacter]KAB1661564.1 FHA domain-containing protein [Pseudoclavibacter sp. CFCC 13796]MCD7100553.1 FHA domain-containing protein [Pseudoclavibacter sp. 13-3]